MVFPVLAFIFIFRQVLLYSCDSFLFILLLDNSMSCSFSYCFANISAFSLCVQAVVMPLPNDGIGLHFSRAPLSFYTHG